MPDLQAQVTEMVKQQGDVANTNLLTAVTNAARDPNGTLHLPGLISDVSIQGAAGTMAVENFKEKVMNVITIGAGVAASIKNNKLAVKNELK